VLQLHGEYQSHEPQIVIAMEVGNEDVADAVEVNLISHHLHLRRLTAIDQEMAVLDFNVLGAGMASVGGYCPAGSENSYLKRQCKYVRFNVQIKNKMKMTKGLLWSFRLGIGNSAMTSVSTTL
jgi:hypothetical protein